MVSEQIFARVVLASDWESAATRVVGVGPDDKARRWVAFIGHGGRNLAGCDVDGGAGVWLAWWMHSVLSHSDTYHFLLT